MECFPWDVPSIDVQKDILLITKTGQTMLVHTGSTKAADTRSRSMLLAAACEDDILDWYYV